jgi:diguanylate cyclase (GGDEF)-like protein
MLRKQRIRVLRLYLAATTFLYIGGVFLNFISPRRAELANPLGGIIAIVLGIGALVYLAAERRSLIPAIAAAMIATPVVMLFHITIGANVVCLVGVMFLAMYLRAFYGTIHAWILVISLTVATVGALALGPGPKIGLTYVIFAVAIIGAAESFGMVTRSLVNIACTDPLTGLLNRAGWEIATTQQLGRARAAHSTITVAALDIDNFKKVNDSFGHQVGDQRLVQYAQRWTALMPKQAVFARLGGDEFALCLPGTSSTSAESLLPRLQSEVPDASIGVATELASATTIPDLLIQADAALYAAKKDKRSQRDDAL